MHKPRRRTRLVNFRITDGELSQVKAASKSVGYRTLSDFARTALLQFSGVPDDTADLKNQIGTLDEKLVRMQSDLQTLMSSLQSAALAPPPSQSLAPAALQYQI